MIDGLPPSPELSIVVPVYRTRAALPDLHRRLTAVLEGMKLRYEIIFVDDACPAGSREVLETLASKDEHVSTLLLRRNLGQHHAVWIGIGEARSPRTVILDGDGQDPPEAIPLLLQTLLPPLEAVFAGRRGGYESRGRLLTSRLFKTLLGLLTGLPRDAGMFVAFSRRMASEILSFDGSRGSIVAMIGRSGLPVASIPVVRSARLEGVSAYSSWGRLVAGCRSLAFVLGRDGPRLGKPDGNDAFVEARLGARFRGEEGPSRQRGCG